MSKANSDGAARGPSASSAWHALSLTRRYSGGVSEPGSTLDLDEGGNGAVAVAAGGILALALGWALDSGVLRVLGLGAAAVGGGLYVREKLAERDEKIHATEKQIRSELDELDPVARAQILDGLGRSDA